MIKILIKIKRIFMRKNTINFWIWLLWIFGGVRVAHLLGFPCCVFVVRFSSSCDLCAESCQCLWIVHYWLPLRFSLTFICSKIDGQCKQYRISFTSRIYALAIVFLIYMWHLHGTKLIASKYFRYSQQREWVFLIRNRVQKCIKK